MRRTHSIPAHYRQVVDDDFSDGTSRLAQIDDNTTCIAFGDINEDGWLDIVAANYGVATISTDPQNRLLLNNGNGSFDDDTRLISVEGDWTFSLALGDVDGDGDLDALARNSFEFTLFTNLTRQVAWRGVPRIGKTLSMALGGRIAQSLCSHAALWDPVDRPDQCPRDRRRPPRRTRERRGRRSRASDSVAGRRFPLLAGDREPRRPLYQSGDHDIHRFVTGLMPPIRSPQKKIG